MDKDEPYEKSISVGQTQWNTSNLIGLTSVCTFPQTVKSNSLSRNGDDEVFPWRSIL